MMLERVDEYEEDGKGWLTLGRSRIERLASGERRPGTITVISHGRRK